VWLGAGLGTSRGVWRSASRGVWRGALALTLATLAALLVYATSTLARAPHGGTTSRPADVPGGGVGTRVELQPLAAQVRRLIEALDYLGAPLAADDRRAIEAAQSAGAIEQVLDRYVLLDVDINPESRVHVTPGRARPELVQDGWRTFLVKVRNAAGVTAPLKVESAQAKRVWSRGPQGFAMDPRPVQTIAAKEITDRWADVSMFDKPPLAPQLSGLELEYRIIQIYSRDAGKREASIGFNVGQGTQDIGFRADTPILFTARPAVDVTLRLLDENGRPTIASLLVRDAQGHVYPSQAKRLAPDFGFQPQIYRADGETLMLAAGTYTIDCTRGPEYLVEHQTFTVPERAAATDGGANRSAEGAGGGISGSSSGITFTCKLRRWIDVAKQGWFSGDHHIHAAGCLHYETPTIGVQPQDMIRHILGEDLNIGAVLTWGPGYYFQKQFFSGKDHPLSKPDHLMHYDVEVSGFPSSHCGHLVLLQLKDQDYPNTRELTDWPTWDLPVLQWAKSQGAVVGFAHSGFGLEVKTDALPNYDMPRFDGIGANEFIVDVTHDAVDFISAVDTPSVWELNIWYHTLNSGFRTRISGETDFPCIFGDRVGLGRSYVQLLQQQLGYRAWVDGVRAGRSYVSDGRSHLLDFRVNGQMVGEKDSEMRLDRAATVHVTATVAARLDESGAGDAADTAAIRASGYDKQPYWHLERARIGQSREVPVEVIVNGEPIASATKKIVADGRPHDLAWDLPIARSSWIALRILPSSHTNPIFVTVGGRPIRASRRSAEWCLKAVDQCWTQKSPKIADAERPAAAAAYEHAREVYRKIVAESDRE
jgi:hypothetical protein